MKTTKIFQHGGSQAVRIPKLFRFKGTEVFIEKKSDLVILKPIPEPKFKTFSEIGNYLAATYPDSVEFPDPPVRPSAHERPIVEF